MNTGIVARIVAIEGNFTKAGKLAKLATHATAVSELSIRLFGEIEAFRGDTPIGATRTKTELWLLALLALRLGKPASREWLASSLWPESAGARGNLRRSLHDLRLALGDAASRLHADKMSVTLSADGVAVDVIEFDHLTGSTELEALVRAAKLYRGPLLSSCPCDWALHERAERRSALVDTVNRIADQAAAAEAIRWLQLAAQEDPTNEALTRRLMAAHQAAGDIDAAIGAFRNLKHRLARDMGWEPSRPTAELVEQLRAAARRSRAARSVVPPKLPSFLSDFVAREPDLITVGEALRKHRLVTIVGLGGIGKTRLAIEAGSRAAGHFPDGVCFVDRSAWSSQDELLCAIAGVLGLPHSAESATAEEITRFMAKRRSLLIIDGAEASHQAVGKTMTALTLGDSASVFLVTSRVALGVAGEKVLNLGPLPVAAVGSGPEDIAASPSVRLFADRARLVRPEFQVTASNAESVRAVCQRLAGVPMAIEIAAAWMSVVSVDGLAGVINAQLPWNDPQPVGGAAQHPTLEATFDWSYDSLSGDEAHLLRALATFRDGCALAAACAVAERGMAAVTRAMRSLVAMSLVTFDPISERYRLLEITRDYALRKTNDGERAEFEARMSRALADLFFAIDADGDRIYGDRGGAALFAERNNFRDVVSWLRDHDPDQALHLELGLYSYQVWPWSDTGAWIRRLNEQEPSPLLAPMAYAVVAVAAHWMHSAAAPDLAARSLEAAIRGGQPRWEATAHNVLSLIAQEKGDLAEAIRQERMGSDAASRAGFPLQLALHHATTLSLEVRDGNEAAMSELEAQLARGRARNDWRPTYAALRATAAIWLQRKEYRRAAEAALAAAGLSRMHCPHELTFLLEWCAEAEVALGSVEAGRAHLTEAIQIAQARETVDREASARAALAALELGLGEFDEAEMQADIAFRLFSGVDHPAGQAISLAYQAAAVLGGGDRRRSHELISMFRALVDDRRLNLDDSVMQCANGVLTALAEA